jgi:FtsP/CotA-like multicopper oxidase with cupredoxin domain
MTKKISFISLSAGLFTLLAAAPSSALDVYLSAKQFTKPLPDGAEVVMWGFAADQDGDLGTDDGEVPSSPGPMITVPPGDGTLNIHLRNDLGVPVSLVIPALSSPLTPVRFTDGQGRSRVQSFTAETAPGETHTYSWNVRPGSFIYHSGTHLPVQVPMGLYGGVKKDSAAGQAYSRNDTAYQNEVLLFYSEIDPALNAAVASGAYGTAEYPGTIAYDPKYFLVNGEPYTSATAPLLAGGPDETTLLRFFNAGVDSHTIVTQGLYMNLLSEDGNLYPFPKEQYSALLPASKTAEAVVRAPSGGDYPVYDRRLFLVNNGTSPGGMFSLLRVSGALYAADDGYTVVQDSLLSVPVPGVCANDTLTAGALASVLTTTSNGSLQFNSDCSFTYTPAAGFFGADSFEYRLTSGPMESNTANVTITVAQAAQVPVAKGDTYSTSEDIPLNVAAPGVLANDTSLGAEPRASLVSLPSNGTVSLNASGSFSYSPDANFNGNDSFSYKIVSDGQESGAAAVNIAVEPVNDLPSAVNDAVSTPKNAAIVINVLANDSDVEGSALSVTAVSAPPNGSAVINGAATVTYTPAADYVGLDTFTYTMTDGEGFAEAAVSVNVTQTPTAVNDNYVMNEDSTLVVPSPGVLQNDITLGENPSAALVSGPSSGTIEFAGDGAVNYTPNGNFFGVDSFVYNFTSGGFQSNSAAVSITVNPVNDAPTAAYDTASTAFNTAVVINALANDVDPDGDALRIAAVTGAPSSGTVIINPDSTFTYTPNTGFSGTDRFYYTATDNTVTSNVGRVVVTVRANQQPISVIDYAETSVNTPVVIDLAANDYDPDGTIVRSTLTVLTAPGRGGSVVNNGDGTVSFTPLAGFSGSDYFYYSIKDNYGLTSRSAKVTVKVLK